MASDPAERPRTAAELVGRLREAIEPAAALGAAEPRGANGGDRAGVAVGEAPRQPAPRERRFKRYRVRALAALGLLAAAAALALVVAVLASGGTSPKPRAASAASPAHRQATPRSERATHRSPAARPPTTAKSAPPARSVTSPPSAASATRTPSASAPGTAAGRTAAPTSSPSGAVEAFYTTAARHDAAAAWSLADAHMRAQLAGYGSFEGQMSRVRVIQFHQANTVFQSSSTASVDIATTAVLVDQTRQCSGRVQTVRGEQGAWLLDHISISCVAG